MSLWRSIPTLSSSTPRPAQHVAASRTPCWVENSNLNLQIRTPETTAKERCAERRQDLTLAMAACEGKERSWCGGVTRDSGIECGSMGLLRYEMRTSDIDADGVGVKYTSWTRGAKEADGSCRAGGTSRRRAVAREHRLGSGVADLVRGDLDDRLGMMLRQKLKLSEERMSRGPPAYERFPDQAFRYRDWGASQTRHARGDAYPLYTLDTLRNFADHLFDSSTGYALGPTAARAVRACDVVYSTLRPTRSFLERVHSHIRVPYLLFTDTADEAIVRSNTVNSMLRSPTLYHWWACDNEVLDDEKLDSVPLGVMDSLELGRPGDPSSVVFHANHSTYLRTLLQSYTQTKSKWLMMQMTETHAERRRVRAVFSSQSQPWGDGEVRLTPEQPHKMRVDAYLRLLGQHRFVLSPRGNGLDAHRTWEALLVGSIPIVRSSALNPLYEALPVLIVRDWADVTPRLLRDFLGNYTIRKPLYQVPQPLPPLLLHTLRPTAPLLLHTFSTPCVLPPRSYSTPCDPLSSAPPPRASLVLAPAVRAALCGLLAWQHRSPARAVPCRGLTPSLHTLPSHPPFAPSLHTIDSHLPFTPSFHTLPHHPFTLSSLRPSSLTLQSQTPFARRPSHLPPSHCRVCTPNPPLFTLTDASRTSGRSERPSTSTTTAPRAVGSPSMPRAGASQPQSGLPTLSRAARPLSSTSALHPAPAVPAVIIPSPCQA